MSAIVDRDGWTFIERRGPYATWQRLYPDGVIGGVVDWGDGDWTFALGPEREPKAGGRCSSFEAATAECDRRWKQSQI